MNIIHIQYIDILYPDVSSLLEVSTSFNILTRLKVVFDQGTRAFGGTPELSENRLGTQEQLLTSTKDSLVNDEIR